MTEQDPIATVRQEIVVLTEGSELLSCTTREEYTGICKAEDRAMQFKKQVEDYWNPLVTKAFALHRELTGKRGEMLKPLEAFIAICKRTGGEFLALEQRAEQERLDKIRREAEAIRAKQEEELKAAAEKLKKEQEAEAERIRAQSQNRYRRKQKMTVL